MSMPASVLTPPLREGERLTSDEFIRRWESMPDLWWAELIDGIVHMPSPVSNIHGVFHSGAFAWLIYYVTATPGCAARSNMTWLMSKDNVPQPDLALKVHPHHGGQSWVEGKYSAGAPELVVEISHTTSRRDLGAKLQLYERSGVREYLIVRPGKKLLVWLELVEGQFREMAAGQDGILRSRVFPGLWLDTEALWKEDYVALAAMVQRGVATAEHAEFLRKLAHPNR